MQAWQGESTECCQKLCREADCIGRSVAGEISLAGASHSKVDNWLSASNVWLAQV